MVGLGILLAVACTASVGCALAGRAVYVMVDRAERRRWER